MKISVHPQTHFLLCVLSPALLKEDQNKNVLSLVEVLREAYVVLHIHLVFNVNEYNVIGYFSPL